MKDFVSLTSLCMVIGGIGALLFVFLAFMNAVGWGVFWAAFTKDIFSDFFSLWPLWSVVLVIAGIVSFVRNR